MLGLGRLLACPIFQCGRALFAHFRKKTRDLLVDPTGLRNNEQIAPLRASLAWAWDDLGYTTGAIFGALNLAENRMAITVRPWTTEGGPTAIAVAPYASYRPLANRTVTGGAGTAAFIWPEQRPGEPYLTIAGSVPEVISVLVVHVVLATVLYA